jgi:signal transduction histidine kinase
VKFEPGEVRLKDVDQETVYLLSPVSEGKGLLIENMVPDGLSTHADENMLDIVVRDLTDNAIEFSNEGGKNHD